MLISLKESQYWVDNCLTLCLSEIEAAIKFNDRKLSRIDRQTFQFNPQKTWIFFSVQLGFDWWLMLISM